MEKKDLEKLQELVDGLKQAVDSAVDEPNVSSRRQLIRSIKGSVNRINRLLDGQEEKEKTEESSDDENQGSSGTEEHHQSESEKGEPIADFFEQIGKGVIDAQKKLDEESLDYMQRQDDRLGAPAAFRLPKASAELSFDVDTTETAGFNIILASRKTATREGMQHKVAFDIVATPPPPELMASLAETSALFPFVGRTQAREAIRKRLSDHAFAPKASEEQEALAEQWAKETRFRKVLIFREGEKWILLDLEKADDKPIIKLGLLEEHEENRLKFTESTIKRGDFGGNFALFYDLLTAVSAQQVETETGKAGTGA